jgi:hypothetical protein
VADTPMDCSSATDLDDAEIAWHDSLPVVAHQMVQRPWCELEAAHPGRHVALAQSLDTGQREDGDPEVNYWRGGTALTTARSKLVGPARRAATRKIRKARCARCQMGTSAGTCFSGNSSLVGARRDLEQAMAGTRRDGIAADDGTHGPTRARYGEPKYG